MLQQTTSTYIPRRLAHPKRLDVFFHAIKTSKLVGALITDRRVPIVRKLLFFSALCAFLIVLLFPDILNEAVLSTVLPFVGTFLGVPLDAGFDWVAFALVGVSLLRIFPAEIVSEHYNHLFHRGM